MQQLRAGLTSYGRVYQDYGVACHLQKLIRVDGVLERCVHVLFSDRFDVDILRWQHFRLRGVKRKESQPGRRQLVAPFRTMAW